MKITVIGTGYVGLVAGTCLADMGNDVICTDNNREKIKQLKNAIVPIYEPGLEELIKVNCSEKRLNFTTDINSAVKQSDVCFIAVGTPQSEDGSCNLKYVFDAAKSIAKAMNGYKVIVDKSTVPVGTAEKISRMIKNITEHPFDVVSNPEFLKQGNAVDDFLSPDRVIIGSNSDRATAVMQEIYSPFLRTANRIVLMDVKSAEMTKYTANSFLAAKISFMNEISNICEKVGADAEMVRIGISTDTRIGSKFLFPGIGYGGSCFPKDVSALISIAQENGADNSILKAVHQTNKSQRTIFLNKILDYYQGNISDKTFGIWGLSFKPKTNDMREAPSITVIEELLKRGAKVKAYDPKAMDSAREIFGSKIEYASNSYEAINGADALILLTEWNEFRRPDMDRVKSLLNSPVIFDGRNQYSAERTAQYGFKYFCIGRGKKE
ncbi:MAG: UDP-glucose/GDP-mannose dehydrogenase family protein [Candidatus Gastranaerophilales bacterium]|nr:UDP-glucose/GDP-mannose dehydrogenase family protein [Candidatus Gastranaerophilales bacterium]